MSRATRTPTTDDAAAAETVAEPPEERTASLRRRGYSLPGLVGARTIGNGRPASSGSRHPGQVNG